MASYQNSYDYWDAIRQAVLQHREKPEELKPLEDDQCYLGMAVLMKVAEKSTYLSPNFFPSTPGVILAQCTDHSAERGSFSYLVSFPGWKNGHNGHTIDASRLTWGKLPENNESCCWWLSAKNMYYATDINFSVSPTGEAQEVIAIAEPTSDQLATYLGTIFRSE